MNVLYKDRMSLALQIIFGDYTMRKTWSCLCYLHIDIEPRKRNYFVMSWMTSKEILGHFLPNYNTQTQWFPYVKMGNMWEWEILLTLVTCLCMRGVKFQVYRYIINRVFLWQRFPSCSCYHINSILCSLIMFISQLLTIIIN